MVATLPVPIALLRVNIGSSCYDGGHDYFKVGMYACIPDRLISNDDI